MKWCQKIGRWITDNIEQPIERFFQRAYQSCADARQWVEHEIRTPIETWRQQQEARCREQECQWLCLCCNKWFCWIVTILVQIIEWIVQVVGEWLVETICNLIVTIIRIIVMVIVQVLKWIVLAIVCIIEALCAFLILLAALAIIALLLAVALLPVPALAPVAVSIIPLAFALAITALVAVRTLCEISRCRFWGIIAWALKWSTIFGLVLSIVLANLTVGFFAVTYGGITSAMIIWLQRIPCPIPRALGPP